MPSCKATWTDGVRFLHTSGTGHALVTDAPAAAGGTDTAPSPMELVLHALCGCMGSTSASILAKMRVPWPAWRSRPRPTRADDHPRIYTEIMLHITVRGAVDPEKFERALHLSLDSYCSVSAMLRATAKIVPTWEILPADDHA
jgi:putative redox protein